MSYGLSGDPDDLDPLASKLVAEAANLSRGAQQLQSALMQSLMAASGGKPWGDDEAGQQIDALFRQHWPDIQRILGLAVPCPGLPEALASAGECLAMIGINRDGLDGAVSLGGL